MKPTVYTEKDGERVIAASKRPDGTVRKERRVREGYTPLDEMPVYQSRAAWAKQGAPRVPGLAGGAEPAKPSTKAATKNAKRKEKKAAEGGEAAAVVVEGLQGLSLGAAAPAAEPKAGAAAAPPAAPAADEPPSVEKQARALRKKIRQCDGLVAKAAEGAALTPEEAAKLANLPAWEAAAAALEAQG